MNPNVLVTSKTTITFPANPIVGEYFTVVHVPDHSTVQYVYDGSGWILFSSMIQQQLDDMDNDPIKAYDHAMGVL